MHQQTGNDAEPGIIPRAMRDVFGYIKKTPSREYLLRCSYLEIYNETIHDLLSPSGAPVGLQGAQARRTIVYYVPTVMSMLRRCGESSHYPSPSRRGRDLPEVCSWGNTTRRSQSANCKYGLERTQFTESQCFQNCCGEQGEGVPKRYY
jgi:Kinesin motor domain